MRVIELDNSYIRGKLSSPRGLVSSHRFQSVHVFEQGGHVRSVAVARSNAMMMIRVNADSNGSTGSRQSSPVVEQYKRRKAESPALKTSPTEPQSPMRPPFLLIDGLLRRQERLHAEQGLKSPPHAAERAFLPEACRRAVDAGRGLLLLLARSYSSNPMLANACAILLFDVLRDPSSKAEVMINFDIINIALECYRLMKRDIGVESGLAMIEQVQTRAREAFEAANVEKAFPNGKVEERPNTTVTATAPAHSTEGIRFFTAENIDSLESNLADDNVAENNTSVDLDNLQFWDLWYEGVDWLKSGFMLPTDNNPVESLVYDKLDYVFYLFIIDFSML
ncbi:uncharacterized protein V1513DRAFT_433306 [Lipomyces chichibuensis]|uniref:uncharacterized protein n=1 Tax=Lipomyces chichibuensis TaxID=1546026 RepID=UPI003343663A